MRKTTTFRRLLEAPEILVMPGVHDALSARIAEQEGFAAITMGGFAATGVLIGEPDTSQLSLAELADHYARVCEAVEIPLLADADTGFGNVTNVRRAVREYERAGVAALFIEDQVFPKRCGHTPGKAVVPAEEMVAKLKAALDARRDPDLVIMARTDALAVNGIEDAIARARLYREVGADLLFVEAPRNIEEMRRICREVGGPQLANIVEFGMTPELDAGALQEIGYAAAVWPLASILTVTKSLQILYRTMKEQGGTAIAKPRMAEFGAYTEIVGLPALRAREAAQLEFAEERVAAAKGRRPRRAPAAARQARAKSGERHADRIIRNAVIVDGTGAARRAGDIAIKGERIAAMGALEGWSADAEVEAGGKVAAPGFIDVHTHDDRLLLERPTMPPKASQGVTTVIVGNCGVSLAPLVADAVPPPLDLIGDRTWFRFARFADYLEELEGKKAALNAACLVGHTTLRVATMDRLDRPANEAEIARMREIATESLDAGAIGLSTGLYYAPAHAAPTAEVIAVAAPLAARGGLYVTHMRDEAEQVLDSLDETFRIGRDAAVPAVISHHKVTGVANRGRTRETLPRIEAAMKAQPLGLDCYPYTASSTVLRLDAAERAARVLVTWSRARPDLAGKELSAIVRDLGCPLAEAVARLQPAGAIYFMMDEEDVRRVLAFPHTMIGSDGLPHDEHPHPRLWGTFPRVLGHYCREVGLFPLEEAVRKMTGLPAARFGLEGRGVLAAGAYADITVFDPAAVIDTATFEKPTTPAAGIALVMVNGEPVWQDGRQTGARPGRVLRRKAR
jgi:N-acyl-D-amino-acid deacylase